MPDEIFKRRSIERVVKMLQEHGLGEFEGRVREIDQYMDFQFERLIKQGIFNRINVEFVLQHSDPSSAISALIILHNRSADTPVYRELILASKDNPYEVIATILQLIDQGIDYAEYLGFIQKAAGANCNSEEISKALIMLRKAGITDLPTIEAVLSFPIEIWYENGVLPTIKRKHGPPAIAEALVILKDAKLYERFKDDFLLSERYRHYPEKIAKVFSEFNAVSALNEEAKEKIMGVIQRPDINGIYMMEHVLELLKKAGAFTLENALYCLQYEKPGVGAAILSQLVGIGANVPEMRESVLKAVQEEASIPTEVLFRNRIYPIGYFSSNSNSLTNEVLKRLISEGSCTREVFESAFEMAVKRIMNETTVSVRSVGAIGPSAAVLTTTGLMATRVSGAAVGAAATAGSMDSRPSVKI